VIEHGKIIGIIGTRKRDTSVAARAIINKFEEIYEEGDWICSGGCNKGGDRFAEQIAKSRGIPVIIFYPNYKRYGSPGALFVRNGVVAETSNVVIACVMNPEDGIDKVLARTKGGTEDTLRKFVKTRSDRSLVHLV